MIEILLLIKVFTSVASLLALSPGRAQQTRSCALTGREATTLTRTNLLLHPQHNSQTKEKSMTRIAPVIAPNIANHVAATLSQGSSAGPSKSPKSSLTRLAAWINGHNVPFLVTSIGMIVMLLWAGSYKMTAPGAEGIIPLVSNSPLISWHFKLFGPYIGSDLIGITEITAALLFIAGYFRPKSGVIGGLITIVMFFITSTMVITTPGSTIAVNGIRYMSFLGLFLYKDVISLGVSFYLISYFGNKAILLENRGE
jgi:uncharacterized membrane protein YkgB